jgi:hypothetical protein
MSEPQSVEAFVSSLRKGDPETTRKLFDSYVDRLVALARKRISQRLAGRPPCSSHVGGWRPFVISTPRRAPR